MTAPDAVTTPGHTSTAVPAMTEDILAAQEPRTTTAKSHASVLGMTAPGSIVDVAVSQPGSTGNSTSVVQAAAGMGGTFHVTIPIPRATAS